MAIAVYLLCVLTSVTCAVLLLRGYQQRGVKLLLWSGLAFVGFAVGNIMLVANSVTPATRDLSLFRSLPVLAGLVVLIYGLVWDTK
ncbi:MAG: hypothetical protein H0W29_08475 [Gemmatimonadales bacterium]|nr:hypothetical protein [Gemmatimonadales bacterium]